MSENDEEEANNGGVPGIDMDKLNQRLKHILGADFNKAKTESILRKRGRGKWNQSTDNEYQFNVSYSKGDTIISMGQIFIIQTPKESISSKYRGYPIPVIEAKQTLEEEKAAMDPVQKMIEKQKSIVRT